MNIQLDKINPKFRELVDLLFFTNRFNIKLLKFSKLLKENYNTHFNYMWDRLNRSLKISWEDNYLFWNNRFEFILSLNDRYLSKRLESLLEKRMLLAIRSKYDINPEYDIEYLQFLEFGKVKHLRKENLYSIKSKLIEMSSYIRLDKLINIIKSFIPIVFSSIDEYVEILTKNIVKSSTNFKVLLELEKNGIKFNKQPIVDLARKLVFNNKYETKSKIAFMTIIEDSFVRENIKQSYNQVYRDKLISLIRSCDFNILTGFHLKNIKNLIDLDLSLADDLTVVFADKLYNRIIYHRHGYADKLIRLIKDVPQISPKKILVYLSSHNKINDIKYIFNAFPDLKKFAAFI